MNAWIEILPPEKVEAWLRKNGDVAKVRYGTSDPHFALWLHYMNRAVQRRVYMSFDDLPDWDYWSAYDADCDPVEAAVDMLSETLPGEFGVEWAE
mgnify:CR=1 FL=1